MISCFFWKPSSGYNCVRFYCKYIHLGFLLFDWSDHQCQSSCWCLVFHFHISAQAVGAGIACRLYYLVMRQVKKPRNVISSMPLANTSKDYAVCILSWYCTVSCSVVDPFHLSFFIIAAVHDAIFSCRLPFFSYSSWPWFFCFLLKCISSSNHFMFLDDHLLTISCSVVSKILDFLHNWEWLCFLRVHCGVWGCHAAVVCVF